MTEMGDHGGDSELELETLLFIYSRKDLFKPVFSGHLRNDHLINFKLVFSASSLNQRNIKQSSRLI